MAGPITTPVTTVKRPLWRRVLHWTLRGLAGVIVLLVLAIAFLHTSWGKNIVRGVVEKRLAARVNGTVKVGSLDYGFLFSSLSIGDIEITNAANQRALAIAKVDLVIERRALLRKEVILDSLTITGLDARSPELKGLFKKSNSKPLAHVQIKRLAVTGKATITKPDGSVIAVHGLDLAGSVDARPAAQRLGLALAKLAAKVDMPDRDLDLAVDGITVERDREVLELAIAKLGAKVDLPDRHLDVVVDGITAKKTHAIVDVAIAKLGAGALALDGITAHIDRAAQHALKITTARIDSAQLAKLLGKPVLVDDVALDLSVTGPESALVLAGTIATRDTKLVLAGKADVAAARPTYELDIGGHAKSIDLTARPMPAVETDVRIHVAGSGRPPLDHEATLDVQIGATKVGKLAVDGVEAHVRANRGVYKIERFDVHAAGFAVSATGDVTEDKQIDAKIGITGNVTKAMTTLAAAGIRIPPRIPKLGKVDLAITAKGALAGKLDVTLAPTRLALAGGSVRIDGDAELANKKLTLAHAHVTLAKLDLAALSRLAGRPPKANGTLSGTLGLTKTPTSRDVTYAFDIALADKPLAVHAAGSASLTGAKVRADISTQGSLLATVDAKLPLDAKGLSPHGAWTVKLDLAKRDLASLEALLPGKQLPAGSVEVHAQLGGSLAKPTGTIVIAASTKQDIALTATLVPSANHLAVTTDGSIAIAGDPLVTIKGTIDMPYKLAGNKPDVAALRAGVVDATIDIAERSVASLASLRPKLATIPGTIGGKVAVKGALKTPAIDARLAWRGYTMSSGKRGETLIVATGTPAKLAAAIDHGALHITADVDRSNKDRMTVHAKLRALAAPLADVIPSFVKVPPIELGTLDTDFNADVVLVGKQLDTLALTGKLQVKSAAVTLPSTKRRYHDITLSLAGEPDGLAIETLTLHETDLQNRRIDITGHLALDDKAKPRKLDLALVSKNWLVFGGDKLGKPDAPRATASFDIAASVDLTRPVLGVDATVKSLALLSPDRLERGHYFEKADLGGDIIFVGGDARAGRLPVVAVPVANKKRRPIDVRVHIPNAIHIEQTPLDLYAKGELAITVRDEGIATRGTLTMERGKVNLFGKDHVLTHGKLTFDDAHPKGELALEFARELPNVAKRDLARTAGTANITFTGPPTKPKVALHGAANDALAEVMAMYNAGRPLNVTRPGEPTSPMATAPRGDQWLMLTFMASNLPHLLFLDRITTWGEHRITNVDAESYKGNTHVRAVVRPPMPGRSENELHVDRVLLDTDRAALGVGVRAGDRLGGGLGLFFEWSSE